MQKPTPLSTFPEAYRYSLGLLSRRDRTSFELRAKLTLRAVPRPVQDQVLEMLSSKGWINDQRSAESFAASRKRMGWGPAKIRAAFFKRGIAGSLAEKALAAEFGGQEEANSAIGLLRSQRRRFRGSGRALSSKGQEKALAFLLRRGFSYVSSHLAVQKVLGYNSDLPEED